MMMEEVRKRTKKKKRKGESKKRRKRRRPRRKKKITKDYITRRYQKTGQSVTRVSDNMPAGKTARCQLIKSQSFINAHKSCSIP